MQQHLEALASLMCCKAAGVHLPQTAVVGGARTGEPVVFRHQQGGSRVSLWQADVLESTDDSSKDPSSQGQGRALY